METSSTFLFVWHVSRPFVYIQFIFLKFISEVMAEYLEDFE